MKDRTDWRTLAPRMTVINLAALSAAMVLFIFLVQGNAGLNLQDEGFLWFGTIRTALGEVPIRDFQSYDPGRYYWGALWFKLLRSDGLMTLRISQAAFQFVGLTVAFLILKRVLRNWLALIAAGSLFLVWMFPPWKIYEPVILIIGIFLAVRLIESPNKPRYFAAGVFVGLAAFFGRNHGVYCFLSFLLVIFFGWWERGRGPILRPLVWWGLGVFVGYLPMLLMLAFVPGLFSSFLENILFNIHHGTNLPLAVPWPWRITNDSHTFREWLNKFAIGITYLAFPVFFLATGVCLFLKRRIRANAVLVASTFFGAVYLHYVFDRPHLYYLAWTIPPFIIGLLALSNSFSSHQRRVSAIAVWSLLLLLSWTAADMAPENYFLNRVKGAARAMLSRRAHLNVGFDMPPEHYDLIKTDIRGDQFWITNDLAQVVENVKAIDHDFIPANENLLAAPYWTIFYPLLRKPSPTNEIYFLFPQPPDKQQRMIADLERNQVKWAFVCHYFLDNRPELAFENTHAQVWQYLSANFEPVNTGGRLPSYCELLHKKTAAGSSQNTPRQ